ncbi:hypothetical protein ACLOJK_027845 [Asimina triloba]
MPFTYSHDKMGRADGHGQRGGAVVYLWARGLTMSPTDWRCLFGVGSRDDAYPHHQFFIGCVSSHFVSNRANPSSRLCLFENFILLIEACLGGGYSASDLVLIRDCYEISSGIDLSTPEPHETPRDHRPGYICLNEFIFEAGFRIPFEFGVADLLQGFRAVSWFCEWKECRAYRYFWRALLVRKSLQGYVTFARKGNAELIDNLPDSVPRWKSRFFYARLLTEMDSLGVPDRWEERLAEPVFVSVVGLEAHQ